MFTGIIEQQGRVISNEFGEQGHQLSIEADFEDLKIGESIAVNGVCLTLLSKINQTVSFDVSPETLKLTTLKSLLPAQCVNLERAMLASKRFGGHYVSGHVDGLAIVETVKPFGDFQAVSFSGFDSASMAYVLPKGSISVDGVSLTINRVLKQGIEVMLVPHTLSHTNLSSLQVGQAVNIEFDYLARIVAHQLKQFNHEVVACS